MPSLTKIQTGFLEPQGAFELTPGTSSSPGLFFTGNTSTGMFSPSSGVLGFSTGSTQQALTILADGKLGIGTSDPERLLSIYGNNAMVQIFGTGGSGRQYSLVSADNTTGAAAGGAGNFGIYDDSSGGGLRLCIDSTGNVGIGITNPSSKLEVYNGDIYLNSTDKKIFLSDDYDQYITANAAANYMAFAAANQERLRITSTGNVGIGTTNPVAKLHIVNTTLDSTLLYLQGANNYEYKFTTKQSTSGGGGQQLQLFIGSGSAEWAFTDGNNVNQLRINAAAGTDESLFVRRGISVSDSTNVSLLLSRTNNSEITKQHFFVHGNNSPWYVYGENLTWTGERSGITRRENKSYYESYSPVIGIKEFGFVNKTIADTSFISTDLIPSLVLKNDGNVGIGTTNPFSKLHIRTASGSDTPGPTNSHVLFTVADDAGPGWIQRVYDGGSGSAGLDGSFALDRQYSSLWYNVLTIKRSDGNVGIGTTNPTAKLYVNGEIYNTSSVRTQDLKIRGRIDPYTSVSETGSGAMSIFGHNAMTSYSVNNQVVAPNGNWYSHFVRMYYSEGIAFHTSGPVSAGDILYDNSNPSNVVAGSGERMRITSGGNVGIGTNNPGERLDVDGSIRLRATGNYTTYATRLGSRLDSTHCTTLESYLNSGTPFELIGSYADAGGFNPRVVLAAGGHKVGIGTDNPKTKIDSRGNILVATNTNGNNILAFGNSDSYGPLSGAPDSSHGSAFIIGNSSTVTNAPSYLSFWTTGGGVVRERLRISSTGNVGVGTDNPGTKLHVNGGAYINPLILNSSTSWIKSAYGAISNGTVSSLNNLLIGQNMRGYIAPIDGGTTNNNFYSVATYGAGSMGHAGTEYCYGGITKFYNDLAASTVDTTFTPSVSMQINGNGHVTKPKNPSFAVTWNGSNINVSQNSQMQFDKVLHNIGSHYSTSTYRFTAPAAGTYQINFYTIWYAQSFSNAAIYLYVNNARVDGGDIHFSADFASAKWHNVSYSMAIYLNSGDYIYLLNGSVAMTYHGNNWSRFSGYLVG